MLTPSYRLPFRVLASPFRLLHTIVEHRALLRQMVARDVTARFVGSSLGAVWSLIQPFILLCLYTFVFGVIYRVRFQVEGVGFVPFLFCGLWPWLAFQDACLRSVTVIVENAQLMKRVQFPSELLVVSAIVSSFLSHAVGFGLMLIGVGYVAGRAFSRGPRPAGDSVPAPTAAGRCPRPAAVSGQCLSCGMCRNWPVRCLRCGFFCLPSCIPSRWCPSPATLLAWNPLTPILHLYRALILTPEQVAWSWVLYPLILSLVLLGLAQRVFAGCKGYFADYL